MRRPANENEKRHFQRITMKAKEMFPNARLHIADSQYNSERLTRFVREDLKGKPVMDERTDEKICREDIYLDKSFKCHENPEMCKLYRRRTACDTMNSRTERLTGRNTLRSLDEVRAYVGMALTLMLMLATASCRIGKPRRARSIE